MVLNRSWEIHLVFINLENIYFSSIFKGLVGCWWNLKKICLDFERLDHIFSGFNHLNT